MERMQRLLCLSLENQPAAELITGTAHVWSEHLGRVDQDRLNVAFDAIEKHSKRWPTIAHIRENLPTYPINRAPLDRRIEQVSNPAEEAARKERIRKLIEETSRRIGEKPEPEEA